MQAIRRLLLALVAMLAVAVPSAQASEFLDLNATHVTIKVNPKGVARVQYTAHHTQQHMLVCGAINMRGLQFRYDRSGGWKSHKAYRKLPTRFPARCCPCDGPPRQ